MNDQVYKRFLDARSEKLLNGRDAYKSKIKDSYCLNDLPKKLCVFFDEFGGYSFDAGSYRVHNRTSSLFWTLVVSEFFKNKKRNIHCFGFDWLGRQYAIDIKKDQMIYLFDPATAEFFELDQDLISFHNVDLVDFCEETLSLEEYRKWLNLGNEQLRFDQCIGFEVPLFLGGIDRLENYELTDMEVHWELSFQLYQKTRNLPEATLIDRVETRISKK